MEVQYCTSEMWPLVRALSDLFYDHALIELPYEVVAFRCSKYNMSWVDRGT